MNKTIILPVITTICLLIEAFTGKTVDAPVREQLADGITILSFAGVSLWGIFKSHKKEK